MTTAIRKRAEEIAARWKTKAAKNPKLSKLSFTESAKSQDEGTYVPLNESEVCATPLE